MAAVSSWNLVFTRPPKQRSLSSSSSSLSWARSLPSFPPKSHLRFAAGASRAASLMVLSLLYAKPTVLVPEKLGDAGLDLLKAFANIDCSYNLSPKELCTKISLCDAPIVRSGTRVTREVFESSGGRLKVVGRTRVGIDNVNVLAATEQGCLVVNAPTANTIAVTEHGIALLASMARNIAQADALVKAGY